MNIVEAKIALSAFRPNSSDLDDPAFAEALALATQNQDLGEWLAAELAQDMAFANSLAEAPIPENLRESIYEVLAKVETTLGYDQIDHDFANSLSDISPPSQLRDEILAAMKIESTIAPFPIVQNQETKEVKSSPWMMPAIGAAAACLVAALLWKTNDTADSNLAQAPSAEESQEALSTPEIGNTNHHASQSTVSSDVVQQTLFHFLNSKMTLDRSDSTQESLYQYLASNNLPSPNALPLGLENIPGVGCKRLDFENTSASLICFQETPDSPLVHLIVMRKNDVSSHLPELANAPHHCEQSSQEGWSITRWREEDKAFFLLGAMEPQQLAAFF